MSRFQFERDTFAYANELVWEYRLEPGAETMTTFRNDPPPTYAHRCFVMARAARQFVYHARFDAGVAVADAQTYRERIRAVVARSPRKCSPEPQRVLIPGYDGLRSFSQGQEALLKAECGGAWQSYFVRSHWRMVFLVPRWHQERTASGLARALAGGALPIIHVFRFPRVTINHAIVLFGCAETPTGLRFSAYDPNVPAHPAELSYDRASRAFLLPRNHYWAGGRVKVVHVCRRWWF
ncbi:MAG TPA: hypothetical protein VMU04_07450 [Candidatus Acidoferrum sp.]|nr:hypothetical protein [Candidatus Acidoferrum sp.]